MLKSNLKNNSLYYMLEIPKDLNTINCNKVKILSIVTMDNQQETKVISFFLYSN